MEPKSKRFASVSEYEAAEVLEDCMGPWVNQGLVCTPSLAVVRSTYQALIQPYIYQIYKVVYIILSETRKNKLLTSHLYLQS